MNIRKHWKKICLAVAALFWAGCNEDNGTAPVVPPQESSSSTAVANSSSEEENGSSSSESTPIDSSTETSSSSGAAPTDSVASSSSSEIKYGYKVYSDTTVRCRQATYTRQDSVFYPVAMVFHTEDVQVQGYVCNNGDSVPKATYTAKDGLLYTPEEYEKLFGPCVEHGGRESTDSVDPKCTNCETTMKVTDFQWQYYDILDEHYNEFASDADSNSTYSEEKKSCFQKFYSDVEPVCAYGTFSYDYSSSITPTITEVEKITCADGTVINEEAYNKALASRDSILAYYEQIYQNREFCENFSYASRLDSCNALDTTGTKIEGIALDTTKVDPEILKDPEARCGL